MATSGEKKWPRMGRSRWPLTLEELIEGLDIYGLVRSTGARRAGTLLREGARFSLAGPIAELRQQLARHGNGGRGVRTFGDLRPLAASYASILGEGDAWRLNVRVWTLPQQAAGGALGLWAVIVRLGWADRFLGEAHSRQADARLGGVFSQMSTRHLPHDTLRARSAFGESAPDAIAFVRELPVADVAALTMALPGSFSPGAFSPALPERTFDGAMLERVPARSFPRSEPYPDEPYSVAGNDLYRLADGRPDPTPVIAVAMRQPNGLTAAQQAQWDQEHKTAKHGIFVIRLPDLGVDLTDYKEGKRRAGELIDAAADAATTALDSDAFGRYMAARPAVLLTHAMRRAQANGARTC